MLNGSNRVGPAGAKGMAAALAKKPALQELHFSGNSLGDVGVATLVRGAVRGRGLRGDLTVESIRDSCDSDFVRELAGVFDERWPWRLFLAIFDETESKRFAFK